MRPSLAASTPGPTALLSDAGTSGHALRHCPLHEDWGLIGLSLSKKYSVRPVPLVRMVPNSPFAADETAGASELDWLVAADEAAGAYEGACPVGAALLAALPPHAAARNTRPSNSAPRDLVASRVSMGSSFGEFQLIGTTTRVRPFQH